MSRRRYTPSVEGLPRRDVPSLAVNPILVFLAAQPAPPPGPFPRAGVFWSPRSGIFVCPCPVGPPAPYY